MLILTLKVPERRKCILVGVAAVAVLAGAALVFSAARGRATGAISVGDSAVQLCLDCLEGFGWEVEETPINAEACVLGDTLSEGYLALQLEAGFDLSDDLDTAVARYTFEVLNYPTGETGVLADILVRDGAVVGGDVRTSDLEGFMHSLVYPGRS